MNRCIQCTRCIRFATEVAGVEELGATGRGEGMEVTTYVEHALTTELAGNLVDLCPVGALTSKPYAFEARSWELRKTELVDVLDALGSNIRVDTRGDAGDARAAAPERRRERGVDLRQDAPRDRRPALPAPRPAVCAQRRQAGRGDLGRGLRRHRSQARKGIDGKKIAAIAGDQCDAESMVALKDLMAALGSPNVDCRQDGAKLEAGARGSYIFNAGIRGIDQADAILLVGTNPRWESPVLNARIRKRYLARPLRHRQHRPGRSISPIRSSGSAPARRPCASLPTASSASPRSSRPPRTR